MYHNYAHIRVVYVRFSPIHIYQILTEMMNMI